MHTYIFYSGKVQGIGFRYTVQSIAHDLGLVGWVKNLPDGRVEMCIEGTQEKITRLCQEIEEHFEGYITSKEEKSLRTNEQLNDFRIRY